MKYCGYGVWLSISLYIVTSFIYPFIDVSWQNAIRTSARLSSNVDAPEGSLEALLQVAVCTNVRKMHENIFS